MSEKDLKINFRYLTGNIACMSVDSVEGKPVHNDIDNEEAIILFNSLVGEKEGCQTIKTLLQKNNQLKEVIEEIEKFITENKKKVYHNPFIDDDCGIEIYLDRLEIEELEKIIIKAKEGVYNGRKSN